MLKYALMIAFAGLLLQPCITLAVPATEAKAEEKSPVSESRHIEGELLPEIPAAVTSFGGAVLDGKLYIYGGHQGRAHQYYKEAQADTLWQLNLDGKPKWQQVAKGPGLQGLAMVHHGGKLYRLGGFTAKNPEQEDKDLWSQDTAGSFDPATGEWSELPRLPEPRSSFDAAVLDDTIYVVGGWEMTGGDDPLWHTTSYALDLTQPKLKWKALPKQPFIRRALSVAAHDGKIYAIGGMEENDGPTTEVAIYDPQSKKWFEGPALPGKGMEGFGSSAFATGGSLYVSTHGGSLLRLTQDGSAWEEVGKLKRERFFHRMLPIDDSKLIFVGGASMTVGKFPEVEVISVGD